MERNIKLLSAFNFFTDFKFHSAVLILYFTHATGSFALAMSLFSAVMVSSALFEVPTGIYSDLIGRKRTVILGAISATASAVSYAAGSGYLLLFIGAVLEGLSRSWYSGNNDALLYESVKESSTKESFAHHLGKTSSMFQLALMVGAVTGSILAQWSFPLIMWLSVVPQAVCIAIAFMLTEPKRKSEKQTNIFSHLHLSGKRLWNNKLLRLLSFQEILRYGIGESSFQFNSAFIATLWPVWAIGFSRLMTFAGAFVSFWYASKIIKKLGAVNVIVIANLCTRIANLVAYGFPTVFSPVIMGTTSLTYGASQVSNDSLSQEEFTSEQRATIGSVSSFFGNIFYGIFAILMGMFADQFGPGKALIGVQILMLGVLGLQLKLKKLTTA